MTMIHQNKTGIEQIEEDDARLFSGCQLVPGLDPVEHGTGEED